MTTLTLALVLSAAAAPTAWEKQSRAFFQRFVDIKIEDDLLVIATDPKGGGSQAVYAAARSAFPNVGRLYIRYASGSSSSSRGGSGNVTIHFEAGNQAAHYLFKLEGPSGKESMTLQQQGTGELSIEYREGRRSVSYSQSKGKCKLRIRAGGDSLAVTKRSFSEVFQENPDAIQRHFLAALESYFDDVPVPRYSAAPPGKVVLHLKDGGQVIGEMKLEELKLHTDYGLLTLPRSEIRQVLFAGSGPLDPAAGEGVPPVVGGPSETIVVTTRFTPKGKLELETFQFKTDYGDLEFRVAEIRNAVFGPPAEEAEPGDADDS